METYTGIGTFKELKIRELALEKIIMKEKYLIFLQLKHNTTRFFHRPRTTVPSTLDQQ